MLNKDRAKQFLPFDGVKGLMEALKEKEKIYEERVELSDEIKEEISEVLINLEVGDICQITFYEKGEYMYLIGKIKKIDSIRKKIEMITKENEYIRINIDDLLNVVKI